MMALVCPVEDSRKKAMSGLLDYRQTPDFFQRSIETWVNFSLGSDRPQGAGRVGYSAAAAAGFGEPTLSASLP